MKWPCPGIPAAMVAEFAGHPLAGLPFFTPETVTTDHRFVYHNHYLVETNGDSKPACMTTNVLRLSPSPDQWPR
ncbi:hypothetical protein GCM10015536_70690 [Streptomyces griseomycini]|nr:hypothetical protein GCM10015536_70690 [Streptomyces griseomycini]